LVVAVQHLVHHLVQFPVSMMIFPVLQMSVQVVTDCLDHEQIDGADHYPWMI
jgi:hypothetical protein